MTREHLLMERRGTVAGITSANSASPHKSSGLSSAAKAYFFAGLYVAYEDSPKLTTRGLFYPELSRAFAADTVQKY